MRGDHMGKRTLYEERNALDEALGQFTEDCRARLYEMVERGKRGWDDPKNQREIARDLKGDAVRVCNDGDRYHLHDIANRAMMIWWQTWRVDKANGEDCGQL